MKIRDILLFVLFITTSLGAVGKEKGDIEDVRLLRKAAEAVVSIYDNPQNLAAIEACGKWDASLTEYAQWRRRGDLDSKEQRGYEALGHMMSVASYFPSESEDVKLLMAEINYHRLIITWNYVKRKDAIQMLKGTMAMLDSCNSLEAENMKLLYRATLCMMNRMMEGDSPLFWDEVLKLEQEFLDLLSRKHVEDYMLYQTYDVISQMKSFSTSYVTYYNFIFNNESPEKHGIIPDTRDKDMINSNSLWYVKEEMQLYKRIAPEEPGNLAQTVFNEAVYVYNYHLAGHYEKVLNDINEMIPHLNKKNVRGEIFLAMLKPWKALMQIRLGKDVEASFLKEWKEGAGVVKSFFGDSSVEYLDYLNNVMTVMYQLKKNEELAEVEKYQSAISVENEDITPEKELQYQVDDLWFAHANISDAEFRTHVSSIVNTYLSSHKPTWGWIEAGKKLATRLSLEMNDKEAALAVHEAVIEDSRKLLPENHIQLAYEYNELVNDLSSNQEEKRQSCLQTERAILEANNSYSPWQTRQLAYCYYNLGDEKGAETQFRKAIVEAQGRGDKLVEAICGIDMVAYLSDIKDCDKIVDKYSRVLESLEDYQYDAVNSFMLAANNYLYRKDTDRAFALYETCRRLILKANVPQTSLTCQFYRDYADTYVSYKNDYDASLQLLEEAIGLYTKGNFSDGYCSDLFQLQLQRFNLLNLKGGGQDILVKKMFCLKDMTELADKLYELSGRSDDVRFTYLLEVLNKTEFLFLTYYQIKNYLRNTPKGTKEYKGTENSLKTINQFIGDLSEDKFEDLVKELKEYIPDYQKDEKYYNLLASYATYCYNVAENFTKGDSLMNVIIKSSKQYMPDYYPTFLYAYIGVLDGTGRYDEAERRMREYENIIAGMTSSLDDRISLVSLKYDIYYKLGRYGDCVPIAKERFNLMRELIDINFDMLTQQERENIITEKGTGANFITYLLERCPKELAPSAYDAMLHEKNLLLRSSERIRRSVLKSGNREIIAALDSINILQTKLRQNEGLGSESNSNEEKMEYLDIQKRMEELERYVARLSAPYRDDNRMKVTWQDVRKKLDDTSASIEIVLAEKKVGMLILSHQMAEPVFVPLTDFAELQTDMASLSGLDAKEYAEALYVEDKLHLYDRLWKPAEPYLRDVKKIYLSPTNITNAIAFNAIKTPDGKTLFDHYDIHQMTTTAFVALPEKENTKAFSTAIFGGIFYDEGQETEAATVSTRKKNGHRGADIEAFSFLKGTIEEAEVITEVLKKKGNVKSYAGATATEQAFCSLSEDSPSLIHLATHGFFISSNDIVDNTPYFDRYPATKYHSMQRSGLAFANANDTWLGDTSREHGNDGILNANEIATLNLSGTKLVTMSACQTALGDYGTDGVFGLQRGFKQAGVHSIMASLWNVDDKCASDFMSSFYTTWTNGSSLHESLRQTITCIRGSYPSPYYWAAFILLDGLE